MSTFVGRSLYSRTMGDNLKRVFHRHYSIMKDHPKVNWDALNKARFIHGIYSFVRPQGLILEFDAAVTAPLFGHASFKDYYQTASSTLALPKIKTPLFILHALDDPIVCKICR